MTRRREGSRVSVTKRDEGVGPPKAGMCRPPQATPIAKFLHEFVNISIKVRLWKRNVDAKYTTCVLEDYDSV